MNIRRMSTKMVSGCSCSTAFGHRSKNASTVSGWVMEQVGRVPEEGDHFQAEGLDVIVTRVEHRRVIEIQVRVLPEEEPEAK